MSTIKTPLLRFLVQFYGNLGFQLRPIYRHNYLVLLNLLSNIFLNLLSLYFIIRKDIYRISLLADEIKPRKPFFSFLLQMFIYYGQTSLHILNILYYLVYGNRIVAILDSDCFRQIYYYPANAKRIFLWGFALNTVNFAILYHNYIELFVLEPKTLQSFIAIMILYMLASLQYFTCNLTFYQQYATREVLEKIEKILKVHSQNANTGIELLLVERMQTLAQMNSELNTLTSLPFGMFMLINLENVIVIVCLTIFHLQTSGFKVMFRLIYPTITWAYIFYLVHLNRESRDAFARICKHFRERHKPTVDSCEQIVNKTQNLEEVDQPKV